MSMRTLADTMKELQERGYTESFRAQNARLVATRAGQAFSPDQVKVDEIYRFEGDADPSDMSILFALSVPEAGIRGTWSSAFGKDMGADAARVVRDLDDGNSRSD